MEINIKLQDMKNRFIIAFLLLLTVAGVQAQFRPMVRAYYYKALVDQSKDLDIAIHTFKA